MKFWRRLSRYALGTLLIGLAALALAACSGSDGSGGGFLFGGGGGENGDGSGGAGIQADVNRNLNYSPTQLIFDQVEVGEETTEEITIENTGDGTINLQNIELVEGGDEGDEDGRREFLTGENWVNSTKLKSDDQLSDGEKEAIDELGDEADPTNITLEVSYKPLNEVPDEGYLLIETNSTDEDQRRIEVPLRPSSLKPQINAPDQLNFTSVEPGTRQWKRFSIQNIGQVPLKITKIQKSGSSTYAVRVPPADEDGGDSGGGNKTMDDDSDQENGGPIPDDDAKIDSELPKTLEPGEGFDLRVWFTPEDNRAEEGSITIFSNDPDNAQKKVEFIGNSGVPCLGLSHEDEINFGQSSTGKVATKTVTVENCRPRSDEPLKLENVTIAEDGGGVFGLKNQSLPGDLNDGQAYALDGDEATNFVVTFTPPENQSYSGVLKVESNDPSRRTHEIKLVGAGSDNECPEAVAEGKVEGGSRLKTSLNTLPLETIVFDGTDSQDPDGEVERYEWSIIDRPADSTARLTPNSNVEQPELFLDLAGTYKVELVVYDDKGAASCGEQAIVEIRAVPNEDIHIQLVWDTPSDTDQTDTTGADLDLHYLNKKHAKAWNEAPWDIFWHNKTADWGEENRKADDPSLDIDDTDGAGPENVNHDEPVTGQSYAVGVYYYDDHGFGPSYATVRIYIDSELKKEYKNKFLSGTFEFWKVGLIEWPTKNIYKRDEKSTGFPTVR